MPKIKNKAEQLQNVSKKTGTGKLVRNKAYKSS